MEMASSFRVKQARNSLHSGSVTILPRELLNKRYYLALLTLL